MIRKLRDLLFVVAALIILPVGLDIQAQPAGHINSVSIKENSAYIFFSDFPVDYSDSLSEDKTKISLFFPKTTVAESAREARGQKNISNVYMQSSDSLTSAMIMLKNKSGYTAVPFPYSNAVVLETFDWKNISPEETTYREGLLALQSRINEYAESQLKDAAGKKVKDAAVVYGIIQLRKGAILDAVTYLAQQPEADSKIPDYYAVLSGLYELFDLSEQSKKYAEQYKNLFAKSSLGRFDISTDFDKLSEVDKTKIKDLLIGMSSVSAKSDSASVDSLTTKDSSNARFNSLFAADSSQAADTTISVSDFLPEGEMSEYSKYFVYFFVVIAVFIVILFYSYKRWKAMQVKRSLKKLDEAEKRFEEKEDRKTSFESDMKAAQSLSNLNRSKVADVYKQNDPPPAPPESEEDPKVSPKIPRASMPEKLESIAQNILAKKKAQLLAEENKVTSSKKSKTLSPKLQLAMHLRDEQKKLQKKRLDTFNDKDIPSDKTKLTEIAKKLGVTNVGLETKKNIQNITGNEKTKRKLADKFKNDNKDSEE